MPTIEIAGKQIETTEMGYLINVRRLSEDLASDGCLREIRVTDRHWDVHHLEMN